MYEWVSPSLTSAMLNRTPRIGYCVYFTAPLLVAAFKCLVEPHTIYYKLAPSRLTEPCTAAVRMIMQRAEQVFLPYWAVGPRTEWGSVSVAYASLTRSRHAQLFLGIDDMSIYLGDICLKKKPPIQSLYSS